MQMLALENYGTSELSFDEQKETDGGVSESFPWKKAWEITKKIAEWSGLADMADDATQGLSDGWNGKHK